MTEPLTDTDGTGTGFTLATIERHKKIREEADKEYQRNAERMKIQYTKQKRHKVYTNIFSSMYSVIMVFFNLTDSYIRSWGCRELENSFY